jgi:hypothetical protein
MDTAKVLSCPVLDEDGEYFGCLSVNDVLKSLNATLQAKDPEWCAGLCVLGGGRGIEGLEARGRPRPCCRPAPPAARPLDGAPLHPPLVPPPPPRTEKMGAMTKDDLLALGKDFCAQTVDKLQHAGDLWLLNADDASTLMDAVIESFRIQDQHVRGARGGASLGRERERRRGNDERGAGEPRPARRRAAALALAAPRRRLRRASRPRAVPSAPPFSPPPPPGAPPPVRVLHRAARPHDPQPQHEDDRGQRHPRQRAPRGVGPQGARVCVRGAQG